MTLAKCDLSLLRHYCSLVSDSALADHFFRDLHEENQRTRAALLEVTEQRELLENNPVLQETLFLRSHYLDPLSYIQVDLLERLRAAPEGPARAALEDAIMLSISGIAAGLKNTG